MQKAHLLPVCSSECLGKLSIGTTNVASLSYAMPAVPRVQRLWPPLENHLQARMCKDSTMSRKHHFGAAVYMYVPLLYVDYRVGIIRGNFSGMNGLTVFMDNQEHALCGWTTCEAAQRTDGVGGTLTLGGALSTHRYQAHWIR